MKEASDEAILSLRLFSRRPWQRQRRQRGRGSYWCDPPKSPEYSIVQRFNKNIARVQNCSDVTILNLFLVFVFLNFCLSAFFILSMVEVVRVVGWSGGRRPQLCFFTWSLFQVLCACRQENRSSNLEQKWHFFKSWEENKVYIGRQSGRGSYFKMLSTWFWSLESQAGRWLQQTPSGWENLLSDGNWFCILRSSLPRVIIIFTNLALYIVLRREVATWERRRQRRWRARRR